MSERSERAVPALSTSGLSKTYADAPAIEPIDVDVARGERVVLLGHNGSGKTTLLRMVAGLLEPSSGSAAVLGHPVGSLEARAATSYVGDQPVFYDDLSVWEHLEYLALLHGHMDWQAHATDLLEAMGLLDRKDDLPTTFSRGLRQKAAITLAFIRPFELLLVDEPFVGLDRTGRDALLDLFRRVHADGAAMVVATHDLTTVAEAERLVALRDGVVVYDGTPQGADVDALVAR
jgi:ABC-2 type transport system ATP-binding protein